MATVALLGIDIGKNTFHLHGQDAKGYQVLRKKLNRRQLIQYLAQLPACTVAMESCGGSHWLAREIIALGHQAKLIAPQHVKPFVTGNKNDFIDAEAICKTAVRPKTRYVPVKTVEQQVLSAEHRVRESLVSHRTATINQVHGMLLEFGISLPVGYAALERVPAILDDPLREIPTRMKRLVEHLLNEIRRLSHDIKTMEVEITKEVKSSDAGCRLLSISGIGPITASALVADVGDASNFRSARDFSASLGLVPRQYSTGGSTVLLNISKRGDKHLRRLMVQGARSILIHIDKREDALGLWARDLLTRKHPNKVACALANKLARIVWAVLCERQRLQPTFATSVVDDNKRHTAWLRI